MRDINPLEFENVKKIHFEYFVCHKIIEIAYSSPFILNDYLSLFFL